MELSGNQYKLLKRLSKSGIKKSELTPNQQRNIAFLGDNGYIEYKSIFENENSLNQIDSYILIQPKGEAAYRSYIRQRNRWFIPLIISLGALIVSIFALYKSSNPINIHIDTNTINSVTTENTPANSEK